MFYSYVFCGASLFHIWDKHNALLVSAEPSGAEAASENQAWTRIKPPGDQSSTQSMDEDTALLMLS